MTTTTTIKVQKYQPKPFDRDEAITEAKNTARLFDVHAKRCDSAEDADRLEKVFSRIARQFEKKKEQLAQI